MKSREVIFPVQELEERRDHLLRRMEKASVDLMIVTSPLSVYYLTGIELGGFVSPQAIVLTSDGKYAFIVRDMEMTWEGHWGNKSWCKNWTSYQDHEHPAEIVGSVARSLVGSKAIRTLGLELDRPSLPYEFARIIRDAMSPEDLINATEIIEGLRRQKSSTELSYIRSAGEITMAGIRAQFAAISSGATDSESVSAAYAALLANGSSLMADPPFAPVGPDSWRAHSHWENLKPRSGDVVTSMLSGSVGRYHCPVERSFIFGRPNREAQSVIDAVVAVQTKTLATLGPGMTSSQADAIARDEYASFGLDQFFLNRLAYSFGLAYPPAWWENEIMQLRRGDERVLEPGMVFHLVPCLCVPGVGFVNRSMPVVITSNGCESLIDFPVTELLL